MKSASLITVVISKYIQMLVLKLEDVVSVHVSLSQRHKWDKIIQKEHADCTQPKQSLATLQAVNACFADSTGTPAL